MGVHKALVTIIGCLILVSGMMAADVSARIEGRWALQVGDIVAGEDISIQKPQASVFHQQTAAMSDIEDLDISFPAFADGLNLGPSMASLDTMDDVPGLGSSASANILPFGPVNLAFPSIEQNVAQTADVTATGFFKANWAYMADTAVANLGTEPLGTRLASGHPFKSPRMLGSEFTWPLMVPVGHAIASTGSLIPDINDLAMGNNMANAPIGNILMDEPVYHSYAPKISFSNQTVTGNASSISGVNNTALNNTARSSNASQARTPTRKPRVDPKTTKEQIRDMVTLPRIYRNAFISSTMHKAYEGPTSYPTWISPYDNGLGCFNVPDNQKIMQAALMKTLPGQHIAPVFWDL